MMGYFASTAVVLSVLTASPEAPRWESDYGKALAATQGEGQPLLVVLDAPATPEQQIDPAKLSEGQIEGEEAALLAPYQLCHVDVTTDYGKKVAKAFSVSTFPHVAIIDKTGKKIIYRQTGKMTDSQWRTALVSHQRGDAPVVVRKPIVNTSTQYGGFDPSYCPSCQRNAY